MGTVNAIETPSSTGAKSTASTGMSMGCKGHNKSKENSASEQQVEQVSENVGNTGETKVNDGLNTDEQTAGPKGGAGLRSKAPILGNNAIELRERVRESLMA